MRLPAELFGGRGADEVAESLRYCGRFSPCRWQTRADLCNENVRFTILDKNKYYNAESAQYILSIGFRPEDTTSEQMLNCIRNLIDIGIIAKDDASS